ncbi:MAG: MBL fold metallo-hydrolase [Candidatus Levybacteria bacterium]|nr:MBL fold metallo-hydrolase [Candidatus Levybacteria bacterium]MBP9814842.1 MBL fold metallo-hydrolase [Candidatus Levybacteria bacterium]
MENVTWFGHASFSFVDKFSGHRIYYVDPFQLTQNNDLLPADIIFITHAHSDHLSRGDINLILKADTIVVATPDSLRTLDIMQEKLPVESNKSYKIKGFEFRTVPAYNIKPDRLEFHPQKNKWVGYIFELNGLKIYHAGDTDFIPEMRDLAEEHLDIAMLPMGGHYTMGVDEMIEAARIIRARKVIPMHYRMLLADEAYKAEQKLLSELKDSEVVILEEFK